MKFVPLHGDDVVIDRNDSFECNNDGDCDDGDCDGLEEVRHEFV